MSVHLCSSRIGRGSPNRSGGSSIADAIFTTPGGNPADILFSTRAPRLAIWSQASTWEHTAFTDFQVTGINHNCSFPECHPVNPVRPEPTTLALLALGGLVLTRKRRRRMCYV